MNPQTSHPGAQQGEALSLAQVHAARRLGLESGRSTLIVLEEQFGIDARTGLARMAVTLGYESVDLDQLLVLVPQFEWWSFGESVAAKAFVSSREDRPVGILGDPFDIDLQLRIEAKVGESIEWLLALPGDIDAMLRRQEESLRAIDPLSVSNTSDGRAGSTSIEDISLTSIASDSSPVVRLVNSTIYDAMKLGASDIHLETGMHGLAVKYRIDGVLSHVTSAQGIETAEQVVSRIKVMAELDIGERRVPQDGRFKLSIRGREVDFRVSIMPSLWGEDVVLRILDKQALTQQFDTLTLELLGFDVPTLETIRALAREPYGMLLATGPTGSGKTTTLYAALSEINSGQDKIVTIEDPVEYQLSGILQIPVNERKGLSFARGLRSILRHDPDKILVGEIRDPETAQIAIQSALTGHLVFTSVHANNVFDVIGRFLHMGVDPYSFVSCLNGVLAQRLVRVNCPDCARPHAPDHDALRKAGVELEAGATLMKGVGCASCRGTGYRGRVAIGEVLVLNDPLREMIVARAPISAIKRTAKDNGTSFLRDAAVRLMLHGRTTLEEINRVTFAG